MLVVILVFLFLMLRLFIIQVVDGKYYSEKQDEFTSDNVVTASQRGSIYDSNMKVMVKDVTLSDIGVYGPAVVKETDEESVKAEKVKKLSERLSDILGLKYEEVYSSIYNNLDGFVYIARSVDDYTVSLLELEGFTSVKVDEVTQRMYSNANSAQYALGFTNVDNTGLFGVETIYNEELSGENGVKSVIHDSDQDILESYTIEKKAPIAGNDLVLSIDGVMQYYADSIVKETFLLTKPKRVMALVTDPNTGEIKAMSTYPSYSLDDPWEINNDYRNSLSDSFSKEPGDIQQYMWKNPFTSFIYEPGSTFKTITTAIALDNGDVDLNSHFLCEGASYVNGATITCHDHAVHGDQTLSQAVMNSCNIAMMDVAQRAGTDVFYKYLYNFGFGDYTGVDLDGEERGILAPNQNVNQLDFVTLSFGQGIAVTPIQLIQGINTVVNGGYLINPRICNQVLSHETGDVIKTFDTEVVRRVISEETSSQVRKIMNDTALNYYSIRDYHNLPIGGKTGTAQKFENSQYLDGKYVTSFYGMIPFDDPQLSILLLVDEPSGDYNTGSTVAAEPATRILVKSFSYLESEIDFSDDQIQNASSVPDLRGKDVEEAIAILDSLKMNYELIGGKIGVVVSQDINFIDYIEGMTIKLEIGANTDEEVIVPDFTGMSVQSANDTLQKLGLNLIVKGGGVATTQSIDPRVKVKKGTDITIQFKYVE